MRRVTPLLAFLIITLPLLGQGSLQHIIVVIQENRTFDEYEGTFTISGQTINGFANPSSPTGSNNLNGTVNLYHASPTVDTFCGDHTHQGSVNAIDGGLMDGFAYAQCVGGSNAGTACDISTGTPCAGGGTCSLISGGNNCYQYFNAGDLPWFYQMATAYGTNDNFFSGMSGPSMPNHFIAIAATTNDMVDNPNGIGTGTSTGQGNAWTCQVENAGNAIPTSAPTSYTTDNGSQLTQGGGPGTIIALNDITSTGTPARYHEGICGGQCVGGTGTCPGGPGCYCAANSACNSSNCSDTPAAIHTRCQCGDSLNSTGEWFLDEAAQCVDHTNCSGDSSGLNYCQITRTYSGTTASPGNLCPSVTTLFDKLHTAQLSHRWYTPQYNPNNTTGGYSSGYGWVAPAYTTSVFSLPHIYDLTQFFTDLNNDALPLVSFITPGTIALGEIPSPQSSIPSCSSVNNNIGVSEHPGFGVVAGGQSYLECLVEAISSSNSYGSTAIFVYYDDFGGFYDHVKPPTMGISQYDNMGVGMRVPNLCVGPYCRNTVVHTLMTPDSITKCIEDVAFGSQSGKGYTAGTYLSARDTNANSACASDGSGFIDLTQTAIQPPATRLTYYPGSVNKSVAKRSSVRRFDADPDLSQLVQGLWRKAFGRKPAREEEAENRPQLATQRPCAPEYVPETAIYHGQPIPVCVWHGVKNGNILRLGEAEGDADEPDQPTKGTHRATLSE